MGEFRGKGRRCYIQLQPVSPGIWHVVSQRSHPDSPSDSWRITVIACLWSLTSSWSHNYRMASRSINQRHRRCRARARLYRASLSLSLSSATPSPLPLHNIIPYTLSSSSYFSLLSSVDRSKKLLFNNKTEKKKKKGTRYSLA